MSKTAEVASSRADLSAWKKVKRHFITLPSGVEVGIEIPNLPQMVKTGVIPNDLLDAALGVIQKQVITPELIKEQADFFNMLVVSMVKEPAISEDDLDELPYEDIELLVEVGTRQRDLDALGRHIGGLHKSAEWRRFRGIDFGDSALEDV